MGHENFGDNIDTTVVEKGAELTPDILKNISEAELLINEIGPKAEVIANDPTKNSEKDKVVKKNWKIVTGVLFVLAAGAFAGTMKDQGGLTPASEILIHVGGALVSLATAFQTLKSIILDKLKDTKNPQMIFSSENK